MAKLKALPSLAIISGFRGKVDYYINHQSCDPELGMPGIPCARMWPRSPGHKRAPAVEAQWPAWTIASRLWTLMDDEIQQAYIETAHGTNLSGRDLASKAYLSGYLKS